MSNKVCCVPGCSNSAGSKDVLHRFPNPAKDKDRFNSWLCFAGGDILRLNNDFIFKYRRICHKHFEEKYWCRNNLLSNIAVPTKNGPDAVKTPQVDSTTIELPSVFKTEEDVNSPEYESDKPEDVDTGIQMITEDEGTPSKSLGSLLVGDRTRHYLMPSTINQPKLLIQSGRNIRKTSTVNDMCETTNILAPIHQQPNKHVLQLRLIDNSTLDEPIYEVITDDDYQTEDNNRNISQKKTETNLPPEQNHTPFVVVDTSLERDTPPEDSLEKDISRKDSSLKDRSRKDSTEEDSSTEELDMLFNEKDKGTRERNKDKYYWKRKLLYIVHNTKFCGICLDAEADMNRLSDEFEIVDNEQTHYTTLLDIVKKVFKETENIACPLICDNCTKKLIQSYIFIYNTEETMRKLNNYLNEIHSKTCYIRSNVLANSHEAFKVHNAIIAFDNKEILQNYDINKQKKNEKATDQNKKETDQNKKKTDQNKKETEQNKKDYRVRRKFRCVSCNIVLPSHRAWILHECTTHKQKLRCIICLQSYRTEENLTKHYKTHLKSNNAVIAIDNKEVLQNFLNNKEKEDKKETEQNKKENKRNKKDHRFTRKFRCVSCNIILPSYRAWELHESSSHK